FFFFFSSPPDLRVLHSFPTRRSSDLYLSRLSDAARALAVYASWARSPGLHARLAPGWWPPFAGQDSHLLGPLWKVSRWLRHLKTDRKSTRLNSSHGSISYAVFFLKKK